MVWVVLRADEIWGSKQTYSTYEADVSTDRLVETDLTGVSEAVGKMLQYGLQPYVTDGTISKETAVPILASIWRIALQALNVEEANDLTDEQSFKVAEPVDQTTQVNPANQKDMPTDQDTEPTEYTANVHSGVGRLQMARKHKGKRKEGYGEKSDKLQEVVDPDTKKFIPAITAFVPEEPPKDEIDAEDIQAAITNWNATKPPELQGILQATEIAKDKVS
jgi:hypothetical protein